MGVLFPALSEVVGLATGAYGKVLDSQSTKDAARRSYELSAKEMEYKIAQENKSSVLAAAEGTRNLLNSNVLKTIMTWATVTIAGAVLVKISFKFMGVR